ncbi:hypothetical protein CYMTET_29781, partial [Cymbomonas tetramitiformis]
GDKERAQGIPSIPMMDRSQSDVPKQSHGFISFVGLPMFELIAEWLPRVGAEVVPHIRSNISMWEALMASGSLRPGASAGVTGDLTRDSTGTAGDSVGESAGTTCDFEDDDLGQAKWDSPGRPPPLSIPGVSHEFDAAESQSMEHDGEQENGQYEPEYEPEYQTVDDLPTLSVLDTRRRRSTTVSEPRHDGEPSRRQKKRSFSLDKGAVIELPPPILIGTPKMGREARESADAPQRYSRARTQNMMPMKEFDATTPQTTTTMAAMDDGDVLQHVQSIVTLSQKHEHEEEVDEPSSARQHTPLTREYNDEQVEDHRFGKCWSDFLQKEAVVLVAMKLESSMWQTVMLAFTVFALFGDDFRIICLPMEMDQAFRNITILVFSVFILELIVTSIVKPGYFLGFFFWLDLVAAISLIPDFVQIEVSAPH